MLNKFFKFLRGYVIINIHGKNAARFINVCLRRGIRIYSSKHDGNAVLASVPTADFSQIRPVARKCRVRVKIKEKHGFRYTSRLYRYRLPFLIAIAVCTALCAVSTRYIWLVEINGADEDNIDEIVRVLDEIGLKRGALKSSLPDGMTMKRKIIDGSGSAAWAWVYIEGAKARVEIYEKIIPPAVIDVDTPCDILAACDGVIKSMTVKSGEERVVVGDAVGAGDLLIAGTVSAYREGDAENYILVHSLAEINAYTTHTAQKEYRLTREVRTPTGRYTRQRILELFGKTLSLPLKEINYENYDRTEKRGELNIPFFGYSGIALNTIEYSEVNVTTEPVPVEAVLDTAKNELEEKIAKELTPGAELMEENLEYEQTDSETIIVTLKMNFTENIAVSQPIGAAMDKGEKPIDNKNDRSAAGN